MTTILKSSVAFSWLLVGLVGCSSQGSTGSTGTESVVQGQLALSTFASPAESVAATDETGKVSSVTPDDTGKFELGLKEGHSYTLEVRGADAIEPIVFARKDGSLTRTFKVTSASASTDLGTIRHHDSAPAEGFAIRGTAEGDAASCEEGIDSATGAVCVDDDSEVACVDQDGKDIADSDPNNTDSESSDSGTKDDVDETAPMAIPEHNVPAELGGCEADDEKKEASGSASEKETDAAGGASGKSETNDVGEAGAAGAANG